MSIWNILGIVAIIALILLYKKSKNAVWGAFIIGIIVGLITGLVSYFSDHGFNWALIKKIVICFVLFGLAAELIPLLFKTSEKSKLRSEIKAAKKRIEKEINDEYGT